MKKSIPKQPVPPNRIVIVLEGGLVQDVLTEQPAQYRVIDYDCEGTSEDELMDVSPATGENVKAYKGHIFSAEQNPDRVAAFFNLPTHAGVIRCPECNEPVWDRPDGSKLAKCWNTEGHKDGGTLAFDTMEGSAD